MEVDFDVIVIGSGAGGGTLAAACANAGKRVLLVERGTAEGSPGSNFRGHDEAATLIHKVPYDDRPIQLGAKSHRLYMGGQLGGGTSVYGGALLRPRPEDFEPGRYYGNKLPAHLHRWPIEFGELAQYFPLAEELFQVANSDRVHVQNDVKPSSVDAESSFVRNFNSDYHTASSMLCATVSGLEHEPIGLSAMPRERTALPLAEINRHLLQVAWKSGLNPYRLPLAIEASKCLRCDHCAGFSCPTDARRSSRQLVESSQRRGESLQVMLGCEAVRLVRGQSQRLDGVEILERSTGRNITLRASRYVLSAGAIGSPVILLRSGFDHPLIGRNYMMHYSPISVGLFFRSTNADQEFVKQLGLSDYYFGTHELPEKMGIVQSLPAPGVRILAKSGLHRFPEWMLKTLRARMLPLVGIVEDLPDPENRVSLQSDGTISLHHHFSDFDTVRGRALGNAMSKLLKKAGAWYCVQGQIPSKEHVAHQCGTLRFGHHRATSVADSDCRLFDQQDVFIADGCFMPSSLGVGPSLTIISNALRIAAKLTTEC